MRIYRVGAAEGHAITQFGSEGVNITGIARMANVTGELHIAVMHIAPSGQVGAHQAVGRQLFLVVRGSGWVRGPEPERTAIAADEVACWENGEEHESGSESGMVALVIEGDALDLDRLLRLKK